ncbi:sugar ABC transporter permease [uncultured Martelella sp.]|uniref:carbohydrate ABC transporter permease n=1 Tax=uncultured Martelella sp. TaxID=392331 RepID=UPI0029C63176|nr:sugar ABC transporter permease [uncultured Martelella sp.]
MSVQDAGRGLRVRKPARRRLKARDFEGYLFLLPWFLGLIILTAGPLLSSLYLSFTRFDMLSMPQWLGLQNYIDLFTYDPSYRAALSVTLTYVVLGVPTNLAFALLVAVMMNQKVHGVGLFRGIYYLPSLLGGSVAIAVMWRQLFGGDGVINSFLAVFGIDAPNWISHPSYAIYTLIILHVWQFGSSMVIFLAGLQQIPRELYEAAEIDGASTMQKFWGVTIPMLTPVIFFNLILGVINSFQAFTSAYIISGGSGGPSDSTLFYTLYLYQEGFTRFHMGYASAMGWILLVIIGAITALNFWGSRHWVFYGDN